ncbi:basic amino acid ABC transporter substrate-binding protein [Bacillus sp. 31A1R]|uniref:Basic amino acid ABC transporter substrate-binding protein n=1 Tax=Robertmurraya mangrovi TaxID=3098077 RepID=A0ABU5J3T0_9BACI|nr:basic amino acid ABC transporter substrate-binding protein [Bacillus sp. 31A1R]MDZ5474074.1 basic amino acid ABC transporter substrate-binding protein [Bacillus sp. 31A1R]
MKKFRKLSFIMLLSMVFILSACGTSQVDGGKSGGEEKKTLKVVTDAAYAPFEYMDKGEIVGFDVDFIEAVAKEAGYELEIVNVGWDPVFVEVKDKIADVGISAITINDDRKQTYDFSVPYFLSTNKILVPEGSDIKSAADLKGKVVAVQNGTTGQEAVEALLGKNNKDIKKFENNNLAIMELNSGGADAVVADNTVVEEYAKNNPNDKLVVVEDANAFESEYYGLMFAKESPLKAEFDAAINKVFENGTYAKIYKEWFGSEPDVENLKAQQ